MVPRKTEEVLHPQCPCPKEVGLEGNPVTVPAGHLHYWLQAHLQEYLGGGNTGHPHHGGLTVGDVEGIHVTLKEFDLLFHYCPLCPSGRAKFGRDHKFSLPEQPLQV